MARVRTAAERSAAARKGWETRRANAARAAALREKRSAAARKGWETRRAKAAERGRAIVEQVARESAGRGAGRGAPSFPQNIEVWDDDDEPIDYPDLDSFDADEEMEY